MVWMIIIAAICGGIAGYATRVMDEEDCPRRVLQYSCKGDLCDHSKSLLYTNMATMAKNDEDREAGKETNLWGGQ